MFARLSINEVRASELTTISLDIPPCLKAGDSCSWFHERTYFIRLPL